MPIITPENPALPGSSLSSGKELPFAEFVNAYVPNRRSGLPWQAEDIVIDSGMTLNEVTSYLAYIHTKQQAGMTTAQIAALTPIVNNTPFGTIMSDPQPTTQPLSTIKNQMVGAVTVGDFVAYLKNQGVI